MGQSTSAVYHLWSYFQMLKNQSTNLKITFKFLEMFQNNINYLP